MMAAPTLRGAAENAWEAVVHALPGFTVEVLARIDSTNSELMRRARAGQIEPVLLVAQQQLAGRGRLGRDWHSEPAVPAQRADDTLPSLTFSLGLQVRRADLSGLSLAVGLTVAQALHPDLVIKWPNDVLLGGRKLAGILIETATVANLRYVVIGVGVNILPCGHADLRTPPAALVELVPDASAAGALQSLVPALVRMLHPFEQHGFAAFQEAYRARDALYGMPVHSSSGLSGVAMGVEASGALLVHTADGVESVSSSEVSVRPASNSFSQS